MIRRASYATLFAAVIALIGFERPSAAPIKLARHPDYHAGRIAFSYLGDIWVAAEDGTDPHRVTDNTGRDIYPRFSPDGRWIAFSSSRYGNNDVFVVPAAGGATRRLTYHTGNDDVVGWTRDSQAVLFRSARGDGAFPTVATLYKVPAAGGLETPLPVDWGYWGSFSPDGKSLAFNRHPAVWSRQHYRGSYAADLWIANLTDKTYTRLLGDEQYNRFWPMWGADDLIYFVGDPLPNEKGVRPGIRDQDRHHDRRKRERVRRRRALERRGRFRSLAFRPARRHLCARADPDDCHRSWRHHAGRSRSNGLAQPVAEVVARRQVPGLRVRPVRP
jgi:hypothetical protein